MALSLLVAFLLYFSFSEDFIYVREIFRDRGSSRAKCPVAGAWLDDNMEGVEPNWDLFETCPLPAPQPWDEEIRRLFDPHFSPIANCDRDFRPWTRLKEGEVELAEGFEDAECQFRWGEWTGDRRADVCILWTIGISDTAGGSP